MEATQPAIAVFGLGIAALITTIFGALWITLGLSEAKAMTPVWIAFAAAALVLLAASIRSLRTGRALMAAHPAERDESWVGRRRRFGLVTTLEGVGCGLVILLANAFHRIDLLAAGISLVVGLHFLPLANLFRFRAYAATGIAIVVSDLLIVLLVRNEALTACVGVATGAILWTTAIYALRRRASLGDGTPERRGPGAGM